jgi:gliding motility-associated-like protein
MKNTLYSLIFILLSGFINAQCSWTSIYFESYEYTTTIPYIIPGSTVHNTPQTFAGCVNSGSRGMYLNITNGYTGLLYSQPFNNLCVDQSYQFTFFTRDAFTSTNNFNVNIYDNNNVLLVTQNIINNSVWQNITMPLFIATTTSIRFEIVTNLAGVSGNDIGFDDLNLNQCQPLPFDLTQNQCNSSTAENLFSFIPANTFGTNGTWSGPSSLTNGHLGTFTPGINSNGQYTYTISGGAIGCPDSIAHITFNNIANVSINPIPTLEGCQSVVLPAIQGTNLLNSNYYTGSNATGTIITVGTNLTTNQTLYAYSGIAGCSDEEVLNIVIYEPYNAGNDGSSSTCSSLGNFDLNSTLTGTFSTNGTWNETTAIPSNQLSGSILSTGNMNAGYYTFEYFVPTNGPCPSDVSEFSFYIGNDISVSLGNDTTFCQGQSMILNPGVFDSYLWDNNSTNQTRIVSAAGDYHVRVGMVGSNIIENGDFELGNTSFTTSYTLGVSGTWGLLSNAGTYAVSTSPNLVHSNFSNCPDHTLDPGNKMLIVNGAGTPNTNVWCQTVPVQTNTDYQFKTWAMSALNDANVAQLQFKINGTSIGNIFSPSPTGCVWGQFAQTWNSGIAVSAQICITNQNTTGAGNDFAIDDISFSPICYAYDTITISNYPSPIISATLNDTICAGELSSISASSSTANMTYNWNPGAINNSNLAVSPTTTTVYTVTGTSEYGCVSNAISRIVFVNQLPLAEIQLNGNDTICYGSNTQLNAISNPNASFVWTPGGNSDAINVVSPTTNQLYTLTVTGSNGCINDTSINIYVIPELSVSISGQNAICETETSTLSVTGNHPNLSYTWLPSGFTGNQFSVNTTNIGWIYITGDYFNCPQAIDSIQLNLLPNPIVTPPTSLEICPGEPVMLSAQVDQAASTLEWIPSDLYGLSQSIITNSSLTISLVAINGACISDTVNFSITVNGACALSVPNVFTPNGDLNNDFFQLISFNGIKTLDCIILNRWGNTIRTFNSPDFKWDGTDEFGNKVNEGVYFYKLNAVSNANEGFKKDGFIELIR